MNCNIIHINNMIIFSILLFMIRKLLVIKLIYTIILRTFILIPLYFLKIQLKVTNTFALDTHILISYIKLVPTALHSYYHPYNNLNSEI